MAVRKALVFDTSTPTGVKFAIVPHPTGRTVTVQAGEAEIVVGLAELFEGVQDLFLMAHPRPTSPEGPPEEPPLPTASPSA
jgi:hypothetical protein